MSGICGWLYKNPTQGSTIELNQMASKLPDGGDQIQVVNTECIKLAALTKHKNTITSFSNDISVAVDGDLRWKISEYQQVQDAKGPAEAIALAYRKLGEKFLSSLGGTYSLALYAKAEDTLLLAVDRMGIKPLCYSSPDPHRIVFASNLMALTQHPNVPSTFAPQSIYNYVSFHFIPSPQTIFNNVFKLEPGQYLKFKNGSLELAKHWQPEFSEHHTSDIHQLGPELNQILGQVVGRYKNTENIGTFLSGGLDSSTVTGFLAKAKNNPVDSYSIGFAAEGYDEISYARIAAKKFNTKPHEYYVTPEDIVAALPLVAKAYDEPFGNSSAIPAYFCSRLAHDNGTRMLLAGDGGDELFAGNERYVKQKLLEHYYSIPEFLRSKALEPIILGTSLGKSLPILKKIRSYVEQARVPIVERMGSETYNYLQGIAPDVIFSTAMLDNIDTQNPIALLTSTYQNTPSDSFMQRMLYLDWKFTLADNDLRKVNRMCEIAGIEVRYPMLDDDLIAFSSQIPSNVLLKGTKLRYFFKHAMQNFLPKEIINKPKHGFGLPFGVWLKTTPELQSFIYGSLEDLKQRNIVRSDFVDNIIDTHKKGHAAYYGAMIWALAMLEQWFQQHDIKGQVI